MHIEAEAALSARHPAIYPPPLCIDCGPGWLPILDALASTLEAHSFDVFANPPVAVQVKEKRETLRVYLDGARDHFDNAAVAMAEQLSMRFAESDGWSTSRFAPILETPAELRAKYPALRNAALGIHPGWLAIADALMASLEDGVVVTRLTMMGVIDFQVEGEMSFRDQGACRVAAVMCKLVDRTHGLPLPYPPA